MWPLHVHVLWPVCAPHNFISNVVVSLTVHDNRKIYLYVRYVAKRHETIVEGHKTYVRIQRTYSTKYNIYIYIYI